jgi:hypothetical protein
VVLKKSMDNFRELKVRDFLGRNECCDWWSTRKETRVEAYVRDLLSVCGLSKIERKEGVYVMVLLYLV